MYFTLQDVREMDKVLYDTLLFDFYGALLTDKQQNVYHMYFCEDLSLAEIGEKLGISRQAVNFSLKHARRSFDDYEAALHLVEHHVSAKEHAASLATALDNHDFEECKTILTELISLL